MKRYLFFAVLVLLSAGLLSACVSNVRYTSDEIKDYQPSIQEQIRRGDISIGMTTQQVRYALGAPETVNIISPTPDGKLKEEWIYSTMKVFMKRRLLFIDGKLVDVFPEGRKPVETEKKSEQQ
jgi:hypothetical protein